MLTDEMLTEALPSLRKYAWTMGIGEDIIQDTCEKAIKKRSLYSPELGKPTSWLIAMLYHTAIDKNKRIKEKQMPEHRPDVPQAPNQENLIMAVETLKAVNKLSFTDSKILWAYGEGYDPAEIAERENMNLKHISKRIWLARQRLIKALGE